MKNTLLKFAGFFVERVPVDDPGAGRGPVLPPPSHILQGQVGAQPTGMRTVYPNQQAPQQQPMPHQQPGGFAPPALQGSPAPPPTRSAPVAVALRAWVPQEHATHLAAHGVHVIAAGGELTVDEAIAFGAQVLIVSSECLGSDTTLVTSPRLPTVFISPQQMLLPQRPGVVQVTEPLRASEVSAAARDALDSWQHASG